MFGYTLSANWYISLYGETMKFSTAVVVFLSWSFSNCSPASVLSAVSDKELECYSEEKIYYKATDKCYKLLTSGPCPRGHWFVLEKPKETLRGILDTTIRGICVREICKNGEYYWTKTKSCVQGKDKKRLCMDPNGEELLTNVFGEGECVCARNPLSARLNGDKRKRCYPLYSQGPCPPSQVLGYSRNSEFASCIPDQCYMETILRKRNRTLSKDAVLAPWENGTCYELGTQGPCPEGLTFKVHPKRKVPNCGSLLNHIFGDIKACDKDENGICQKRVAQRKRSTGNKFMKELQFLLSKKK